MIAITSPGTPLSRESTLAITLDVPEDTDIYMPMVSRLAQLTVIDVLARPASPCGGEQNSEIT